MSEQGKLFNSKFVPAKEGSGRLFDEELVSDNDEPVTCLGKTFKNDNERRVWFTEKLRDKLEDPEFRMIEGFPIGSDEDILKLSDPPYYTACPNPWISDFIDEWEDQRPELPKDYYYLREPFATDVSEGKNDPIYSAHAYHTKVPHKAVMRYILHYTEPGDIVFDGFAGTGMTGVAAQLCGDRQVIMSLGYQVKQDGTILKVDVDEDGRKIWKPFSKLGIRHSILNDLSPIATFIGYNYNSPVNVEIFQKEANRILKEVERECGWMYETIHTDGKTKARIEYTVWSEIFNCPNCTDEIVFLDEALDHKTKRVKDVFLCPNCGSKLSKKKMERCYETIFDSALGTSIRLPKRKPSLIVYKIGKTKYEKKPDDNDLKILERINKLQFPYHFPIDRMMHAPDDVECWGDKWRAGTASFSHIHHLFLPRAVQVLSFLWQKANSYHDKRIRNMLKFFIEQAISGMNIQNRYGPHRYSQSNGSMPLVYYMPSQISEVSPWYVLRGKLKRLYKTFKNSGIPNKSNILLTGSSEATNCPQNSIDYIFTDPPFGNNIAYAELNFIYEAFHKIFTNIEQEAIESKSQGKSLNEYRQLMAVSFKESYRILKPGRWMTVEFSNTNSSVWNSIKTALTESGFIVANVSALDKKQGSFNAVTNTTSVKQDLVISAYKPNGGFEERFQNEAQTEEGVWDFVRTHLKYLPVTKRQGTLLQFVPERDPRILWDAVVSYYMRKRTELPPTNSPEFQIGLAERFIERDGMYFLPDQVAEYDRKKMISGELAQVSMFVSDEATAIQWLRQLLKQKPQTFADINPQFMQQLGGWSKNEAQLDLRELLHQNFLIYDGKGPVPEQIHAYLSSNWKDMRNLSKDNPDLVTKAKDRWYVPDPNKAGDLEKLREKALLKEFEEYREVKKKLKVFRLEAVRTGFKKAWQEHDYDTIIEIANKIPNNVLEEDQKLLMWYDQAVTRNGGE